MASGQQEPGALVLAILQTLRDRGQGSTSLDHCSLPVDSKRLDLVSSRFKSLYNQAQIQYLFILICTLCTERCEPECQRDDVTLLKVMHEVKGRTENSTWVCWTPCPVLQCT